MIEIFWLAQRSTDVPDGDDWLGPAEREVLSRLRVPKRRADWRLGRWTAKQALRACPLTAAAVSARSRDDTDEALPASEDRESSADLALATLEIGAAEDGAPEARFRGTPLKLTLSLSHSVDRSIAAVAPAEVAVGCDVEKIERRSEHFVRDYFAAAEISAVEAASPDARDAVATLIWGAKESALKALRVGLRFDTRSVHASVPKAGMTDAWQPLSVTSNTGERDFCGWSRRADGFIEVVVSDAGPGRARLSELVVRR